MYFDFIFKLYKSSVCIYAVLWTCYYCLMQKFNNTKRSSAEWNSRIVAITHAVVVTKIIDSSLLTDYWLFDHLGEVNTPLLTAAMSISAGYFLFKTSWCVYMKTETYLMILHHVISLCCLIGSLWMNRCGAEVASGIWGSELTNPFLQFRWFLRETGRYHTMFALLNDVIFIVYFGVVRILIGGYLLFNIYCSTKPPFLIKIYLSD